MKCCGRERSLQARKATRLDELRTSTRGWADDGREGCDVIERVWRGWTTAENGSRYERLLREQIFPGIAAKGVRGYTGIRLLRRQLPSGELEFMTIMSFESLDAVRAFAGEEYARAYVPEAARQVLLRFDETSALRGAGASNLLRRTGSSGGWRQSGAGLTRCAGVRRHKKRLTALWQAKDAHPSARRRAQSRCASEGSRDTTWSTSALRASAGA